MLILQCILCGMVLLASFLKPSVCNDSLLRIERGFRAFACRKATAVILVFVLAIVARCLTMPVEPAPEPRVDDEFSHLLLADTLTHGRLANPTPHMWRHLETFDENMVPTYSSVYPPMQGLFLAAGRLVTGSLFAGVCLSVAVMCAAICWMLQGWLPPQWALLGGVIAITQYGVFTYWSDSYWGGAPAAIGGALVLGALPRLKRLTHWRFALLMALGFAILGNSRPYEGFLLALPVAASLLRWFAKLDSSLFRKALSMVAAPLVFSLLVAVLATGFYFWKLTGNPFRTPYQTHWEAYGMMPKFIWQSPRPTPNVGMPAFKEYYAFELKEYEDTQTAVRLLRTWGQRLSVDFIFYLGPILVLPIIFSLAGTRYGLRWQDVDERARFHIIVAIIATIGLAVEVFGNAHYASPFTACIVALILFALRSVRSWRPGGRMVGTSLSRVVPLACALAVVGYGVVLGISPAGSVDADSYYYPWSLPSVPSTVLRQQLNSDPGAHLVIVRYASGGESGWSGWVENEADIDHSKIVWAWDLGIEKNREILDYYKDRRAWLVDTGDNPLRLVPYSEEAEVAMAARGAIR